MNYPTETESWMRPAETLTDAAMRELRAAVAEYARRAVMAEAEMVQARRLLHELWDSVDARMPSIDLMSRVLDELAKE